ncbi:Leishmanolysin-like peptidase, partial [Fragariocoptes setiger]
MPTVANFFREILTIKKDDALQRYRIRRRCPQNVVVYMPTIDGISKPFCLDRCEDYATCGEIVVPSNHLAACSFCDALGCRTDPMSEGEGVGGSQFLLYVSADNTSRCRRDHTIAYAAHCAQDLRTDRPIAGHANLCPDSISTDPKDLSALIATVKHELTHVLGFSVSLFAYYRDENGQPLTERGGIGRIPINPETGYPRWSERTIKKVVRKNWITAGGPINKTIHLVVTPAVKRAVREHFNCSDLAGAELEDQGADGTSMTHWEKRLFENEAMTGTHTQNSVYSRVTLAMLQDTGWYKPNYSRADELEWGKNLGCDFVEKSCKSWIDLKRSLNMTIRPFCDKPRGQILTISCTDDRSSKAVCNMKTYEEPLDPMYRNFDYIEGVPDVDLAYYGGSVDLADYCPFIQEFTWQAHNVTVRGSRCEFEGNNLENERNANLEQYGPQTKCFEHARRWEQRSCNFRRHWHHSGAGCYKYQCHEGHLSLIVQNETFPCYEEGQIVRIELLSDSWLHSGSIACPACEKVCPPHKCYFNATANLIDTDNATTPFDGRATNLDATYQIGGPKHKLTCSASSNPPIIGLYLIAALITLHNCHCIFT